MLPTCTQCHDPFTPIRKPLLFPCGHSSCERCLSVQVWKYAMRNKSKEESVNTPTKSKASKLLTEAEIRRRQIEESEGIKCAVCAQPSHKICTSQFPPNYSLQEMLSASLVAENKDTSDESYTFLTEKYILETFAEITRQKRVTSRATAAGSDVDLQCKQGNSDITRTIFSANENQVTRDSDRNSSCVRSFLRTCMQYPFVHPFHLEKRLCHPKITMLLWLLFQIHFNYSISSQLFDTACFPLFMLFILKAKIFQLIPVAFAFVFSLLIGLLIGCSSYSLSSLPLILTATCIVSTLLPPSIILSMFSQSLIIQYCGFTELSGAQYLCFLVLYVLASMPSRKFDVRKQSHSSSLEEFFRETLSPIASFLGLSSPAEQSNAKRKRSVSAQTDSSMLTEAAPIIVDVRKSSKDSVYQTEPRYQELFPSVQKPSIVIPQSPPKTKIPDPQSQASDEKPKPWRVKLHQWKTKFGKSA